MHFYRGDYLTLTRDNGTTIRVYFPKLDTDDDVILYCGADGSTYWDRGLCALAQAPPTPTPTLIYLSFQPMGASRPPAFPVIDAGDRFGTVWPDWGWR